GVFVSPCGVGAVAAAVRSSDAVGHRTVRAGPRS
ncbi:hypothetical protein STRTUCAR8_09146, partial [Streptomyces turgidiscabies Car8]